MFICWQDKGKQPTNFITNILNNSLVEVNRNFKTNKTTILMPLIAKMYNDNMGNVDTFNSFLSNKISKSIDSS